MTLERKLAAIAMLIAFPGLGLTQDEARSKPSVSVALSARPTQVKLGGPAPVKLTMTNTSDHDLHLSVMYVMCPPLINAYVTVRQMQVQLYDDEGNPVPLTVYGTVVQGRSGAEREPASGKRERGIGCGGHGQLAILKPGESRTEEADLSKEFDIKKPGTYTLRAQKLDNENKAVVKSGAVSVTFTAAQ
ncbi:MAG TPA: hypothetical protein VG675_22070 [Bryobacteraceae bacterium]|nr:hypothetical protein [Bryobacteraceae bacterium]